MERTSDMEWTQQMPWSREKTMGFKPTRKKTGFLESRSHGDSIHRIVDQYFLGCMSAFGFQSTGGRLDKDFVQLCMRLP